MKFHLGDILSIVTPKLVSPNGIEGVYRILNYMVNDSVFTHQLGRVSDECRPWLLRQHPQLADVDYSWCNHETWKDWLDVQVKKYGNDLEVDQIPPDDHTRRNPIEELCEMVGPEKVIVVQKENE